jgi:hypothetical protein
MSTFTSVLKKIGTVLLDGAQVATEVLGFPFISQILGGIKIGTTNVGAVATTVSTDFNTVASIISVVEAAFPAIAGAKTGSAKLTAATPLVQQALMTWASSNLPGHSKVKDSTLLAKAAGEITGGFADFLNALGD